MIAPVELARWALYVDLGVMFGVPAAGVLTGAKSALGNTRGLLLAAALAGFPLSILGFMLTLSAMAGVGIADLDRQLLVGIATGSALGWAFLVRIPALVAAAAIAGFRGERLAILALPAAIAVATLAWSGHAAASEGAPALVRLAGDIVHLLAASLWIGAMVLFLAMLSDNRADPSRVAPSLSRFAGVGSMLVAVLLATGFGNLAFVSAPSGWPVLLSVPYARFLLVKLGFFAVMLGLAALHRFKLVPRLAAATASENADRAGRSLRVSLAFELAAALIVLLIVSHLGMLDPHAS